MSEEREEGGLRHGPLARLAADGGKLHPCLHFFLKGKKD